MSKKLFVAIPLLVSLVAIADTPPARTVNSETYDAAGNGITSTTGGGKQALDTNVVSGNVSAKVTDGTNTAAVKGASAAPTVSDNSLVVAISPNSPITVTSTPPTNTHTTGTLTAACLTGVSCPAGSTVQVTTDGASTMGFETHGTWNAAITQDISYDPICSTNPNSALWFQTASIDTGTYETFYITTWGPSENNDSWVMNVAGAQCARLRAVTYTSGTVSVTLTTGVGTAMVWSVAVGNTASGATDIGNPVKVGGRYNSTLPTLTNGQRGDLQLDSSGRLMTRLLTGASDTVTANQGGTWTTGRTWSLLNTTDSVDAVQSGTWNINNVSGTVSLPTGAATAANQTTANSSLSSIDTKLGTGPVAQDSTLSAPQGSVTGGTAGTKSYLFGGQYNSTLPTLTTGQQAAIQLDSSARLVIRPLTSSDVVTANQGGTWTTGRTWSLLNTTDSVNAVQSGTWNINNISGTVSLPTGAATAANQTTANSSLSSIDGKLNSLGQKAMTGSVPVVVASDQSTINIQGTGTTGSPAGNVLTVQGTGNTNMAPVIVGGSAAVGAAPSNNPVPVSGVDGGGLKRAPLMDTSGRQQILVNDTSGNGVTSTLVGSNRGLDINALRTVMPQDLTASGSITTTCSTPTSSCPAGSFVAISINGAGSAQLQVSGTFTGASLNVDGTVDGINWVPLSTTTGATGAYTTASFSTTGKYRIYRTGGLQQLRLRASALSTGTVSTVIAASIATDVAEAVQLNAANLQGQMQGNVASGATDSGNPVKAGGVYNTTAPSLTNGQRGDLQLDQFGNLGVTQVAGASYRYINTATTSTLRTGAGRLLRVCLGTSAANGNTITLYDNTAGSGAIITLITTAGGSVPGYCGSFDVPFSTGLTAVTTGTSGWTLVYQ